MSSPPATSVKPASPSRWWLLATVGAILAISLAHYATDIADVGLHNVYRRLPYVPIILAAFLWGLRGGLLTAAAACLAYAPHAFLWIHHRDPSPTVDKVFEMALYLAMGGLTGWLVERQRQAQGALERSLAERDAIEAELVRAGKMSALGQLTAGLAHEIRNPLASILGSAEAVVGELAPDHRKYRIGQLLLQEIDRLDRVVGEFVRFARPIAPRRAPVDVAGLARRVVELSATEAAQRGIDVGVEAGEVAPIEADGDQLGQVLLNLLLNAYQALERVEDERPRRVRVRLRERDVAGRAYQGVGVEDSGPGIPAEVREEVFNPYFTTRPEGVGLGLSVSNRIVEAHGGFMEIDAGVGTTGVWFYLPRRGEGDDR